MVRLNRPLGSSGPHAKEWNQIQNIDVRYRDLVAALKLRSETVSLGGIFLCSNTMSAPCKTADERYYAAIQSRKGDSHENEEKKSHYVLNRWYGDLDARNLRQITRALKDTASSSCVSSRSQSVG